MSVTQEQARVAIVTKVAAIASTWVGPTLIVDYDNKELVNWATQTNPFLSVEIVHIDGYQAGLSNVPVQRVLGTIVLTAKAPIGSGMKALNDLLEFFYPAMHMTDSMTPVRTYAARLVDGKPTASWRAKAAVIPFWYDN